MRKLFFACKQNPQVYEGKGTRKGTPLPYTHLLPTMYRHMGGASPCGRPGNFQHALQSPIRILTSLWFIFMLVIGTLASITAHSTAPTPYAVTITSNNFRVPLITLSTDDISDAGNARFSLQNGTSLWYGITLSSTPAGIVPTAANPTNDLVSTTFLSSTPLLPPAQVLPFDQWNGSYHFETLKLKAAFSGPGQQVQLELSPMEHHAVTLDVLTLLLQLLGQKQNNIQIGLLETGVLQNIFSSVENIKDFSTLIEDYTQALTATQNTTTILPKAYACALAIASLLSDGSEQAALADILWKLQGKAITRESILKTIVDFAQTQFGLATESFINNYMGTLSGMFSQSGNPTVLLQTVSTATPSMTPSVSMTPSPTHTPIPTTIPTTIPTIPQEPVKTPATLTPIK